jgi:hypothetical protein
LSDGQLIIPDYRKVGKTNFGYDLVAPDMAAAYYDGRYAMPYAVFLFLGVVPLFGSLGLFLFLIKSKEEKEKLQAQKRKTAEEKRRQQVEQKEREEIRRRLAYDEMEEQTALKNLIETENMHIILINCLI